MRAGKDLLNCPLSALADVWVSIIDSWTVWLFVSMQWSPSPFSGRSSHPVRSGTPWSPPCPRTQPQLGHSRLSSALPTVSPFSASPASALRVTGSQNVFQTWKEYCGLIISEHFSQTFLGPQICNLATLHKCPDLKRLLVCLLSLLGFFPFGASDFFLCWA